MVPVASSRAGATLVWATWQLLQGALQADQFGATASLLAVQTPLLIDADLSVAPVKSGNPSVVGVLTADGNLAARTLSNDPLESPIGQFVDFRV